MKAMVAETKYATGETYSIEVRSLSSKMIQSRTFSKKGDVRGFVDIPPKPDDYWIFSSQDPLLLIKSLYPNDKIVVRGNRILITIIPEKNQKDEPNIVRYVEYNLFEDHILSIYYNSEGQVIKELIENNDNFDMFSTFSIRNYPTSMSMRYRKGAMRAIASRGDEIYWYYELEENKITRWVKLADKQRPSLGIQIDIPPEFISKRIGYPKDYFIYDKEKLRVSDGSSDLLIYLYPSTRIKRIEVVNNSDLVHEMDFDDSPGDPFGFAFDPVITFAINQHVQYSKLVKEWEEEYSGSPIRK